MFFCIFFLIDLMDLVVGFIIFIIKFDLFINLVIIF